MFKAEGEQVAMHYVPQQQPQQQFQPQGHEGQGQPNYGQVNTPMVAQAIPVNGYPNYIPPQGIAVAAVPLVIHPTRGMWSDGLCECFNDCESCLLSWIIPPWLFGRNVKRSGLGDFGASFTMYFIPWLIIIILSALTYHGVIGVWGDVVTIIGMIFLAVIGCMFRGKLRLKYAIPGDQMEDMCMHCCCVLCALAQEARHINRANSQGNAPPVMPMQPMGVYAPQQYPQQFQQQQFQPQQFQPQQFQPQQFPQQQQYPQQPVFAQPPSGYTQA